MMSSAEFEALMTALATTAQMSKLFYDACVHSGFTEDQALELTKSLIATVVKPEKEDA